MELVFVVVNGHAQLRIVKTGKRIGDEVELVSGVDAGEPVVVEGAGSLVDGQPVEANEVRHPNAEGRWQAKRDTEDSNAPIDSIWTSEFGLLSVQNSTFGFIRAWCAPIQFCPAAGLAGRIARAFIDSKLTPLVIIASVLLGLLAVLLLPREEEPQIKVPMVDVLVSMPGFSAKEVEERATRPMEKLLWEIPGVEYLYSTSSEGQSLVIVRFKVGEDMERSLVKLNQKLQSNFDKIPHGVSPPLIKARSIDDVPILALTFHSPRYDHLTLRRLVAQVDDAVKQVPQVAETTLIGGAQRQVRVLLDPARLASRNLSPAGLIPMLQQANRQFAAGGLTSNNKEVVVETGAFLKDAEDVGNVVVGVFGGKPVYLRDVADIVDGAEEPSQYVFFGTGAARM